MDNGESWCGAVPNDTRIGPGAGVLLATWTSSSRLPTWVPKTQRLCLCTGTLLTLLTPLTPLTLSRTVSFSGL